MSLCLTRKMNTGLVFSSPEGKLLARVVIRKDYGNQVRVYIDAPGVEVARIDEDGKLEGKKK